jgi:hypothetical protein
MQLAEGRGFSTTLELLEQKEKGKSIVVSLSPPEPTSYLGPEPDTIYLYNIGHQR